MTPRIVYCGSHLQVTREAALLVAEARRHYRTSLADSARDDLGTEKPETEPITEESRKPSYEEQDFIALYGAASLGEQEGGDEYRDAIHTAMGSGIRVRRYVRLLNPNELMNRNPNLMKQYAMWLARQYDDLLYSPNSHLINNIRAPQWGTANSSLITHIGILEIKGAGASGIAIYDAPVAASMRQTLSDEMSHARPENRREYATSIAGSMDQLKDFILKVYQGLGIDPTSYSKHL